MNNELYFALRNTRDESGLSLKEVAETIKDALEPEELTSLIKELTK